MNKNIKLKVVNSTDTKKIHHVYDIVSHRSYDITMGDIAAYESDWGWGHQIFLNKEIRRGNKWSTWEDTHTLCVSYNTLKKLGLVSN